MFKVKKVSNCKKNSDYSVMYFTINYSSSVGHGLETCNLSLFIETRINAFLFFLLDKHE